MLVYVIFIVLGVGFLPFAAIIHGGAGIPVGLAIIAADVWIARRVGMQVRAAYAVTSNPTKRLQFEAIVYALVTCWVLHAAVALSYLICGGRFR